MSILADYIPVNLFLKYKDDKITINAPLNDLADFEDWLNQNQANKAKWKYEKFDLDDATTGSTYQIFRNHIQLVEWPFISQVDGAVRQGIYMLDPQKYEKAKKK